MSLCNHSLGLFAILAHLRLHGNTKVFPLFRASFKLSVPIESISLVSRTDAAAPLIKEKEHVNNIVGLRHDANYRLADSLYYGGAKLAVLRVVCKSEGKE